MVILDSTILIDCLKGHKEAMKKIKQLEDKHTQLYTTQINVFEIIKGIYAFSHKIDDELLALGILLQKLEILDITYVISCTSGRMAGELLKKGISIHVGDLIIAGTAIANNIPTIVTNDVKDFSRIPGIKVESY